MSPAAPASAPASPDWVLQALKRHETSLLRYAASLVGASRAQDVVQDVFLRLCSQPQETVSGHLAAWLFTVCRNRALELRRAERRLDSMAEDDMASPDSGPIAKLERAENLSRMGTALATLPSRQREALELKVQAGLSYRDIAQVMNLTVTNVGFVLHQAIANLREQLAAPSTAGTVTRNEGSSP